MIVQLSKRPKAWINTLVLAGVTAFAASANAEEGQPSAHNADAIMVTMNDVVDDFDDFDYADTAEGSAILEGSDGDLAQVGFIDDLHKQVRCKKCNRRGNKCFCCVPWWAHGTGASAQFLLLRPGNVDHIYAIEQNDPTQPGEFPTGPIGRVNIDDETGYRLGLFWAASDCTSLVFNYTDFDGSTDDGITATTGNYINGLTLHPSTDSVGDDGLEALAGYSIDFQLYDLTYRHVWKACDSYVINWFGGFRYGEMGQRLVTEQLMSVATGLDTVTTDVNFDGFGMTLGIDGERRSCRTGMMVYGRGLSSFMAGDWVGNYSQVNQFAGGVVANEYEDYRVTPVLELEVGLGWVSPCGKFRATAGYTTSAWYNAVSTRSYVDAVRSTDYVSVDETITFSGLTTGLELRF